MFERTAAARRLTTTTADFDVITAPVPRNTGNGSGNVLRGGPTPTNHGYGYRQPESDKYLYFNADKYSDQYADRNPGSKPDPAAGSNACYKPILRRRRRQRREHILNDYVEIKNISSSIRSLNGLWLYYGSATGNFASTASNAFELPNVSLNPGQYYLVQLGNGRNGRSSSACTPDATTVKSEHVGNKRQSCVDYCWTPAKHLRMRPQHRATLHSFRS